MYRLNFAICCGHAKNILVPLSGNVYFDFANMLGVGGGMEISSFEVTVVVVVNVSEV